MSKHRRRQKQSQRRLVERKQSQELSERELSGVVGGVGPGDVGGGGTYVRDVAGLRYKGQDVANDGSAPRAAPKPTKVPDETDEYIARILNGPQAPSASLAAPAAETFTENHATVSAALSRKLDALGWGTQFAEWWHSLWPWNDGNRIDEARAFVQRIGQGAVTQEELTQQITNWRSEGPQWLKDIVADLGHHRSALEAAAKASKAADIRERQEAGQAYNQKLDELRQRYANMPTHLKLINSFARRIADTISGSGMQSTADRKRVYEQAVDQLGQFSSENPSVLLSVRRLSSVDSQNINIEKNLENFLTSLNTKIREAKSESARVELRRMRSLVQELGSMGFDLKSRNTVESVLKNENSSEAVLRNAVNLLSADRNKSLTDPNAVKAHMAEEAHIWGTLNLPAAQPDALKAAVRQIIDQNSLDLDALKRLEVRVRGVDASNVNELMRNIAGSLIDGLKAKYGKLVSSHKALKGIEERAATSAHSEVIKQFEKEFNQALKTSKDPFATAQAYMKKIKEFEEDPSKQLIELSPDKNNDVMGIPRGIDLATEVQIERLLSRFASGVVTYPTDKTLSRLNTKLQAMAKEAQGGVLGMSRRQLLTALQTALKKYKDGEGEAYLIQLRGND